AAVGDLGRGAGTRGDRPGGELLRSRRPLAAGDAGGVACAQRVRRRAGAAPAVLGAEGGLVGAVAGAWPAAVDAGVGARVPRGGSRAVVRAAASVVPGPAG